ncbi:hypothetical protein SteCoe_1401 [Stentor coeruleus]|uniref:Uncharacterized protein n=1 Tax=Stentor coeruleus TaxID=5963 RepID=A0A1R2D1P8_9CILI|nr:hypothetical protein SteCoe_1401 [Stentor coeruleus]
MNASTDIHNNLCQLSSRPPKHPLKNIHLPSIVSSYQPSQPKFSISKSPRLRTIESSLGYVNTSLTPKASSSYRALFNCNSNDNNEDQKITDIEKIITQQSYVYVPKNSNSLIKNYDSQPTSPHTSKPYKKVNKRTFSDIVSHIECEPLKLPQINPEIPEKSYKKLIIPDIPKAAFGVHKPYHDLNIHEDFKLIQIEEKPRDYRFRSRTDSLVDEIRVRDKVT